MNWRSPTTCLRPPNKFTADLNQGLPSSRIKDALAILLRGGKGGELRGVVMELHKIMQAEGKVDCMALGSCYNLVARAPGSNPASVMSSSLGRLRQAILSLAHICR